MRSKGEFYQKSAFTLIELLVVLAVIGILASILIPVIGNVRSRAEMAECSTNLRSIGQGILMYATEHNGELPPGATIDMYTNWYHLLEPYVGQFVTDPELGERPQWQACPSKQFEDFERRNVGYGWNYQNFGSAASSPDHGWRTKLVNVQEPSNTIIVGDSADLEQVEGKAWANVYIYDERYPGYHARRHNDGGNYLMVDGSVHFIQADDLIEKLPEIFKLKK
ncbi:prepilin-type N-terminal cleavage/methylation domain-containing protein [Coraliomargarita sp. W4R53]